MLQFFLTIIMALGVLLNQHLASIVTLAIIFFLNVFSTMLGNLRTIFLARRVMPPVYIATFIDALVFAVALKAISTSSGIACVLVFAAGRLCGVSIAQVVERKLALGTIELTVNKHMEEGVALADRLRKNGYSVTTLKGYGINGSERLILTIIAPRKHLPKLKKILASEGKINMALKDVTQTYGKVGQFRLL